MNKLILILFFIHTSILSAMSIVTITMPNKEMLKKRLSGGGFNFVSKDILIDRLAGQQTSAIGIVMAIDASMREDGDRAYRNSSAAQVIRLLRKEKIINVILQDNPSAMKEVCALVEEMQNCEKCVRDPYFS